MTELLMFEVNVKNVRGGKKGRRREGGPARVWGSDTKGSNHALRYCAVLQAG